jgi:hypothetical protein
MSSLHRKGREINFALEPILESDSLFIRDVRTKWLKSPHCLPFLDFLARVFTDQ